SPADVSHPGPVRSVRDRDRLRVRGGPARARPHGCGLVLSFAPTMRIFVALEPVDMRGSFEALAGHVRRLQADPLNGHPYLFVNKRRRLLKALWFDRTGW